MCNADQRTPAFHAAHPNSKKIPFTSCPTFASLCSTSTCSAPLSTGVITLPLALPGYYMLPTLCECHDKQIDCTHLKFRPLEACSPLRCTLQDATASLPLSRLEGRGLVKDNLPSTVSIDAMMRPTQRMGLANGCQLSEIEFSGLVMVVW